MTDRRRLLTGGAARPTRARLATLLVFLANGTAIGAWAASIPRLKADLALSDTALGFALLAVALGAMVAMPLAGRYGQRLPSHALAGLSGVAMAGALVLPGLAWSLPTLVAGGLLLGASNGTMDVSMNAHASLVERGWGGAIMSSFHAAFSLGGFMGSLAATGLAAASVGRAGTLALLAGGVSLLVVAGVLVGLGLVDVPPAAAPAVGTARDRSAARGATRRVLAGISALTFIAMLVEGATADWAGVFLTTVVGAPLALGSAVYAAFAIAMVAGRLVGDRVVRSLGGAATLRLGAALTALGLAVALLGTTPVVGVVGFTIVGLGVSNIIPVLFSAAARTRPDAPAIGVSAAATVGYTGFLLGPPVIGALADHIGLRLALAGLPVAVLAIVAGAAWARDRPATH